MSTKEYFHEYYLKNKDKIKERNNKWRLENKERFSELVKKSRRKRAERLKANGEKYIWHSEKERKELYQRKIDKDTML